MGNYSKKPADVFKDAQDKGYNRVRFQQGKPILDRELNLLGDLAAQDRLARQYIGNGIPQGGADAFKISNIRAVGVPLDFDIEPGTCLVNGYEVVLAQKTTYRNQPYKEHIVAQPPPGDFWAYLRVFTREVNDSDDASLGNGEDVGFETSLREKVEWEVVVLSQDDAEKVKSLPEYFELGVLVQSYTGSEGGEQIIYIFSDRRVIGLTMRTMLDEMRRPRAPIGANMIENGAVGLWKMKTEVVCYMPTVSIPAYGSTSVIVHAGGGLGYPRFLFMSVTTLNNIPARVTWSEFIKDGNRCLILNNEASYPVDVQVIARELFQE